MFQMLKKKSYTKPSQGNKIKLWQTKPKSAMKKNKKINKVRASKEDNPATTGHTEIQKM